MPTQELCRRFFTEQEDGKWRCKCGKELIKKKGCGWTNLVNHLKSQHPDYNEIEENKQAKIDNFVSLKNKKAENVFGWLEWICVELLPFSTVEKEMTRKYTNLTPICVNTFMKYMNGVVKAVENKIKAELPDKFALVFDGWTTNSTHFVLTLNTSKMAYGRYKVVKKKT